MKGIIRRIFDPVKAGLSVVRMSCHFSPVKEIKCYIMYYLLKEDSGAVAQSVTVKQTGCGFDPHSRR